METVNASGHCLCGAVRIAVSGTPIRMVQCHCLDCQRVTGTGHASNVIFKAECVDISGQTQSFDVTADSGNILTRHFCPGCGSRIFLTTTARPGLTIVSVGLLEDSSWFKPQAILYTKRRPPWDITATDVPSYESMPAPAQSTSR